MSSYADLNRRLAADPKAKYEEMVCVDDFEITSISSKYHKH